MVNFVENIGALPDFVLREMEECVRSVSTHANPTFGPASIDIPCGGEFYRLPGVMLPLCGETVWQLVSRFGKKHSTSSPLEVGRTYAVPLGEVKLPEGIYGYYNPKSSVGRVDVHCRVIADNVSRYDTARPEKCTGGYRGYTWLLITPNSFDIAPPENIALVQVRLFSGDTRFNQKDLEGEWEKTPLAFHFGGIPFSLSDLRMSDADGSVLFTADLKGDDGLVGYRAKVTREILDLGKISAHDAEDFFDPVRAKNRELLLAPGVFYLLRTNEVVFVPPHLASELRAMDERLFEGRSHYAGFLDPGFRDRIVLEVRCSGMLLREGQPVARIQFERLTNPSEISYETREGGHYNRGNTFLSKYFRR